MTGMGALLDAHERATDRFVALLREADDGGRPVPHLSWTVAELAAHVLAGIRGYHRAIVTGTPPWPDLEGGAEHNERMLAEIDEGDPGALALAIERESPPLRESWLAHRGGDLVWQADLRLPVVDVAGVHLADVAVHEWDLARALGRRWGLDRADATLIASASVRVAPEFVDSGAAAGVTATYALHLRGGPTYGLAFDHGTLTVTDGRPPRADCRLSADPGAFVLAGYGRVSAARLALTGRMASYGRRPWLGLRFKALLRNP